jgi:hypothetical protein
MPATGYRLTSYNTVTGEARSVGGGCAATVSRTGCTESEAPAGSWRYAVRPVFGPLLTGAEGPTSGTAVVPAA